MRNNFCYGKDTSKLVISEFQKANRFPYYNYQFCMDCNSVDLATKLCTFSANYFTSHPGANLTCPLTRSQYYTNSIDQTEIRDYRYWDLDNYEFPFCKINSIYKTPTFGMTL